MEIRKQMLLYVKCLILKGQGIHEDELQSILNYLTTVHEVRIVAFKFFFIGEYSLVNFVGRWHPCFGLMMMSDVCLKAKVGPLACTQWIPQINLWCDTCRPLGDQHNVYIRRGLRKHVFDYTGAKLERKCDITSRWFQEKMCFHSM